MVFYCCNLYTYGFIIFDKDSKSVSQRQTTELSELVQLKLNIEASDGDSTPSEEKRGTPTYRSGGLKKLDENKGLQFSPELVVQFGKCIVKLT